MLDISMHAPSAIIMAAFEHRPESAVRGFHIYKDIWTPTLHQCLQTMQDAGNTEDPHAVAVVKHDASSPGSQVTVGHVPREFSRLSWYFLQNDGEIMCEITGRRRRSPLVQGGMEIPCIYKFVGKKKHIKKLVKLLKKV